MEFHMQFFFLFPAIIFLLATIVHSNGGHFIQAYEQSEAAVSTVHRTGYHFQPKKHWMNADVEVVFSFPTLDKAEIFDDRWENHTGEDVCAFKGGLSEGGLGPFGLATLASNLSGEFTPVSFTIFKDSKGGGYRVLMCSDVRRSSTREEGLYRPSFGGWVDADVKLMRISLRCLIDHSIVESFGAGGKIVISSRVYPVHAIYDQAELYVFNNGTELVTIETLDAWSMKNAVVN